MEFIKKSKIETDDFYYDLFEGGFIKLDKVLKNGDDIEKVKSAIKTIIDFKNEAENKGVVIYH